MSSLSKTTKKTFTNILKRCSPSSLFPPRQQAPPAPGDWELNRGRVELRTLTGSEETDPEKAGFPSARQIAGLNRRVLCGDGQMSNETVHLISSREPQNAAGADLKKIKRAYWRIESDLHSRLDQILDEDRSRVRTPRAAHILGMFRRLAVSFAIAWTTQRTKQRKRTSTRYFLDHMRADNARRAFTLVTAKCPASWMAGK